MTAPRVPLTPRGRRAAPVGVSIATAMFDALNKAQDDKAANEAARIAAERADAELARKRTMEDTRLRLDLDKSGYRIADPTAERGQDEIVIGASPLGSGVLTRIDPELAKKRKAKGAFTRLQTRDAEKWREEVEDFDYEAAETQELAIDAIADQLEASGMLRGLNKAQIRAKAAGIASDNPQVRSLFEASARAMIPKPVEEMTPYQQAQLELERRRVALAEQTARDGGKAAPAPRPLTEGQRKASAFLLQAEQANQVIEGVAGTTSDPVTGDVKDGGRRTPTLFEKATSAVGLGGASNFMKADDYRRMESAAFRLSDAWLRYTSGAAVPEPEVKRFAQGFMPAPGDDPATLADKARARRLIIKGLREGVGRPGDVDSDVEAGLVAYTTQRGLEPPPSGGRE